MKRPRVSQILADFGFEGSDVDCLSFSFTIGMLEQVRRQTEEAIIKIKTETEELDKDRRTTEEKNKKERANKIQNEVIQSHKKNVEIDWNWQELEEKEDCKELAEVSFFGPKIWSRKL